VKNVGVVKHSDLIKPDRGLLENDIVNSFIILLIHVSMKIYVPLKFMKKKNCFGG